MSDKEILDYLDSEVKKPYGWEVSEGRFIHISNGLLTTCENDRGKTFREAMIKFLKKNTKQKGRK